MKRFDKQIFVGMVFLITGVFTLAFLANAQIKPLCPAVNFSASPSSGDAPLSVALTADATDYINCQISLLSEPGVAYDWSFDFDFTNDGIFDKHVDSFNIGHQKTWSESYTYNASAVAKAKVTFEEPSALPVSDTQSASITVSSKPDLIVEALSFSPSSPAKDNLMTFSGSVRNQGMSAAASSQTRLQIDIGNDGSWDVNPSNMSTGSLNSGTYETETWTNIWTAQQGTHKFRICADVAGVVSESNEANNCAEQTFSVSGPLITVSVSPYNGPASGRLLQSVDYTGTINVTYSDERYSPEDREYEFYYIGKNPPSPKVSFGTKFFGENTLTLTQPVSFSSEGTYSICLRAKVVSIAGTVEDLKCMITSISVGTLTLSQSGATSNSIAWSWSADSGDYYRYEIREELNLKKTAPKGDTSVIEDVPTANQNYTRNIVSVLADGTVVAKSPLVSGFTAPATPTPKDPQPTGAGSEHTNTQLIVKWDKGTQGTAKSVKYKVYDDGSGVYLGEVSDGSSLTVDASGCRFLKVVANNSYSSWSDRFSLCTNQPPAF